MPKIAEKRNGGPKPAAKPKATPAPAKPPTPAPKPPAPAPAPKPAPAQPGAPAGKDAGPPKAIYPELKVLRNQGEKALKAADAAAYLGLVTEEEWAVRVAAEQGIANSPEEAKKLGLKFTRWHHVDPMGRRCFCANITKNRSISEGVVKAQTQDILTRCWAGPTILPGTAEFVYSGAEPWKMADGTEVKPGDKVALPEGTVNGQPIVIGRDGQVVDGQKKLLALWDARCLWELEPERWTPFWPTEPVMDALIVLGVSNHQKVIQTLDNTQSRSEGDTFETTGAASRVLDKPEEVIEPKKRQEVCRMLQHAVDFAWARSDQTKCHGQVKTIRAAQDFLDRHPRLYKAVRAIFDLNQGRAISLMRLSAGTSAAALWLMAQGKTNPAKWRGGEASEEQLDMSLWAKAEEFWTKLARKEGALANALADALPKIETDDGTELQGSSPQKFALIAKAWRMFLEGAKGSKEDLKAELRLETFVDKNGVRQLLDPPDFGGIDAGPKAGKPDEPDPEPPTEAEIEAKKAELLANRQQRAASGKPVGTGAVPAARAPGEVQPLPPQAVGKDGKPLPVKALPSANGAPQAAKPKPRLPAPAKK